jgi:N-acyl-D-amino-acid deacylase
MLDIHIRDAEIIDGIGNPRFTADVGVLDKRIVLIAKQIEVDANAEIDGEGLQLAPGFIDPHTHSDLTLLGNRRADSSVHQGVTTEVIGNCGVSAAPANPRTAKEIRALSMGLDTDIAWQSMAEYLQEVRKPGTAVNVVPLIGHGNVRGAVLGYDDVGPTPQQLAVMENIVDEAIEQGARGLSAGLYYAPGMYACPEELIGLGRLVARHGGIYACHIRSESKDVLAAAAEAIDVGRRAGVPVEYSHIKISGRRNWGMINHLLELIESPGASEARLGCDQYPYAASSTFLSSILPHWAQVGGGQAIAHRMTDTAFRARLKRDWRTNRSQWDDLSGVQDWTETLITDCRSRPEVIGQAVSEAAELVGKDPLDTVMDLLALDSAQIGVVFFDQDEDIVRRLIAHPHVAIGSDSMGASPSGRLGENSPHPRSYGTFPRVLGRFVREEKILSLEEGVRKMTSISAQRFGLRDRGVIREGAWADLVLFDAQTVADRATFVNPHQHPDGIHSVIVNGMIVIEHGVHTGALPGLVL